MPKIDQALIAETWRRIQEYDRATAIAEAQRFAREQPAVLHFTREFLREFDEATQGTALGLAYLVFLAAEARRGASPPSLSPAQIERWYGIGGEWLDALQRTPLERWAEQMPSSAVALYILQTCVPSRGQAEGVERRRSAHLLILLTMFLEALPQIS
jgi:hypothetical protein